MRLRTVVTRPFVFVAAVAVVFGACRSIARPDPSPPGGQDDAASDGTFDTALPSLPVERAHDEDEELKRFLDAIDAQRAGAMTIECEWTCECAEKLDTSRESFGPRSLKSALCWNHPTSERGYWDAGAFRLEIAPRSARLDSFIGSERVDWFLQTPSGVYCAAFCDRWPTVCRFQHDLLESGGFAYTEGVGLLLWAVQGSWCIRFAENLAVSEPVVFRDRPCDVLVATPDWIRARLRLKNRRTFPFNHSTLARWAEAKPVIHYFVDSQRGSVLGAQFDYYKVVRSAAGDWEAIAVPSGVQVVCWVEQLEPAGGGALAPARLAAEVYFKEDLIRTMTIRVTRRALLSEAPVLRPPPDKRSSLLGIVYRSEDYAALMASGDTSHSTRLGHARALAFEGRVNEASAAVLGAVDAIEEDFALSTDTFSGIDWDFGWATYDIFRAASDEELDEFWRIVPRTQTWSDILSRAVSLYTQFQPKGKERLATLMEQFNETFTDRLDARLKTESDDRYRAVLQRRLDAAAERGERDRADRLRRIIDSLE